jgi:hypothetical protein
LFQFSFASSALLSLNSSDWDEGVRSFIPIFMALSQISSVMICKLKSLWLGDPRCGIAFLLVFSGLVLVLLNSVLRN